VPSVESESSEELSEITLMGDAIASGTGNFTSRTSMLGSLCQIRFDARLNASLI
jgi:hypothetical protein